MTQPGQFAPPVMRCPAGLGAYQAGRQLLEERQHLRSSQRLANDDLTGRADTVNLKNVLGQIEADRAKLYCRWLLLGLHDSKPILALRCREREPSTASAFSMPEGQEDGETNASDVSHLFDHCGDEIFLLPLQRRMTLVRSSLRLCPSRIRSISASNLRGIWRRPAK